MPDATATLLFRGIPFYMNGRDYYVPSLSLRQFQDNYELLTKPVGDVTGDNLKAQFEKFLPVILLALNRNYPDVTYADLENWLDLVSFREMLLAVQGASGMKAAKPGE